MAIKRRRGLPFDAALGQPWVGTALPRMPGLPFGTNAHTKDCFNWDPWWAHELEVVHSAVYLFTGEKGYGKSAAEKAIALRYGARRGRDIGDGKIRQMRMLFNDRKLEGKEPEFIKVVNYLNGTVVPLSNFASINVFDKEMNMDEKDMVETAVNIVEMVSDHTPLPRFQNLAVEAGVWKMLRDRPSETGPELLEAKLYSLTLSDVDAYLESKNEHFAGHHIRKDLFEEDASEAATRFGEVLKGTYGGIFGSQTSLREVLTDDVVLLDWTGVSEKARTLLSALLWKWRSIAQRRGDQDMIPDMIFSDEEHQALHNLMYARFMSASLKEVRSQPTAYFMSTQHETTDLAMAGDVGTELRTLSESIGNSIGARFIGRQPNKKATLDFYREMGFSELNVQALPYLPKGHFFFYAPGFAPVPFKLELTPTELMLSDTTSAVRSMTRGTRGLSNNGRPTQLATRRLQASRKE